MFDFKTISPDWQPIIRHALATMDQDYLANLQKDNTWLPGKKNIFNAFKLPLKNTRYILFGESPYPRAASANGFAFWDAAVGNIWNATGFSKPVNRATSLRNFIKMLMVAQGSLLMHDTSQAAIAAVDKTGWVEQLADLFANLLAEGVLLLNTSLVLSTLPVSKESRYWHPFIGSLLEQVTQKKSDISLILMGKISDKILTLPAAKEFTALQLEHPYNHSFISNKKAQTFFKSFNLLEKHAKLDFLG